MCVCVCASQRISLSALARTPQKGLEGEISRKTGSGGEREGPKKDRESQLTKEDRREQLAYDSWPEKDTDTRRRQCEDRSRVVKR